MKVPAKSFVIFICLLGLVIPPPASAQPQPPDGCSLGLSVAIQSYLDALLLGACDRHDACWRAMNPCYGPYLGTNWKATCDTHFLADLTAICVAGKSIIPFPNPDFDTADDFFEACALGATAAYTAVSAAFPFWHATQCLNGCNLNSCALATPSLPFPQWCCPWMFCQCSIDQHCDALPPITNGEHGGAMDARASGRIAP